MSAAERVNERSRVSERMIVVDGVTEGGGASEQMRAAEGASE